MRRGALRIALIYVIATFLWMTLTDKILLIYQSSIDDHTMQLLRNGKRFVTVVLSGFFLYKLVLADRKKLIESQRLMQKANTEKNKLADIIMLVNNMIVVTDENNIITWINKAVEDFTGYKLADMIGKTPTDVFTVDESDINTLNFILQGKKNLEAFSADISCYTKTGKRFWVAGEFTPLLDEKHKHTGYISVYSNISWRKEKEEEILKQNNKLKEVAWLSSHQVRRPLANIMGLIKLINQSSAIEDKVAIFERIYCSAQELDEIVHTINSKSETSQPATIS